jgi:hypothetical protein
MGTGREFFRRLARRRVRSDATKSPVERHTSRLNLTRNRPKVLAMKTVRLGDRKLALAGLLAGFLLAAAAISARAGLGGDDASVESDASVLQGKMAQSSGQEPDQSKSYSIKTFVTANGVTVREYVARSGAIFGVAWQGRRPPDLSVLLGSYYPEYVAASGLNQHANLHHEVMAGPNSIVFLHGHMGHLVGRAYVPSLAPSGVDAEAMVK